MGPRPKVYCSFCGKNQDECDFIVAGPSVAICEECIDLCADQLAVHKRKPDQLDEIRRLGT